MGATDRACLVLVMFPLVACSGPAEPGDAAPPDLVGTFDTKEDASATAADSSPVVDSIGDQAGRDQSLLNADVMARPEAGTIPGCETTLLHTAPGPSEYPPLYAPAAGTEASLDNALDALFAATDTVRNVWTVKRAPVSLTPSLEGPHPYDARGGVVGGMLLPADLAGEFVTRTAMRFFLEHPEVFQSDDEFEIDQIQNSASACSGNSHDLCIVRLQQKYCGLELGADDSHYSGYVDMQLHLPSRRLWRVQSATVPHAPVYASPKLTAAEAEASLMGIELPMNCPGGSMTVDQTAAIQSSLGVFVRRPSADASVLEYRTAYKSLVEPNGGASGVSWNVWVDAFEGVVLAIQATFICN